MPVGSAQMSLAMRRTRCFLQSFLLLLSLPSLLQTAAAADTPGNFFANKQIKVIVSSQVGADYDLWMRFIAPYMSRYIPGTPPLLVQNMPGAGGIVGANYLFNVAPRDGTVIGMIGRNLPFQAVVQEKGIRFDLATVNWIGNPEVTSRVCAHRPTSDVKSASDLFKHELMIGGAGAGGGLSTIPQLLSRNARNAPQAYRRIPRTERCAPCDRAR